MNARAEESMTIEISAKEALGHVSSRLSNQHLDALEEETIFILEGVDKAADESVAGRARAMASSRNIPVIDVVRGVTHPDVIARAIRSTPMHPSQARLYYLGGLLWSALPC